MRVWRESRNSSDKGANELTGRRIGGPARAVIAILWFHGCIGLSDYLFDDIPSFNQ